MPRIKVLFGGTNDRFQFAKRFFLDTDIELVKFEELVARRVDCSKVSAIWTELTPVIDSKLLENFSNLKYVFTSTTGISHLDTNAIEARDINIISLKHLSLTLSKVTSTSELAWCLVLSLWRNLVRNLFRDTEKSISSLRELYPAYQISGKKIGIIGYGRIGRQLSQYALSFGMEVSYFDPYIPDELQRVNKVRRLTSISELLKSSDIVVVCASESTETKCILSREAIKIIKPGAMVVNTARGSLWDELAVADALIENRLGGVGVDVYQFEELKNNNVKKSPLLEIDPERYNIIATPHIGGATSDALELVTAAMAEEILRCLTEKRHA